MTYLIRISVLLVPTAVKHVQHSCGKAKNSATQPVAIHSAISVGVTEHFACRQVAKGVNTASGQGGVVSKPSRGTSPDSSCRAENEYGNLDFKSLAIL